jgi:hypothetical protein
LQAEIAHGRKLAEVFRDVIQDEGRLGVIHIVVCYAILWLTVSVA